MKRVISILLCTILTICTCVTPGFATDITPKYTIETLHYELELPVTIPAKTITGDFTGRVVRFPSFKTICVLSVDVDVDSRNGEIVRVSVIGSGVEPSLISPDEDLLEDKCEMTVEYIQLFNNPDCVTIASDKRSFRIDAELICRVRYQILWLEGTPPTPDFDERFDIEATSSIVWDGY